MATEGIGEAGSADAGTHQGGDGNVFVCYSHSDSDEVYPEIERLRAEGVNVWYDEGIALGTEWTDELAAAIDGCRSFLFYATTRSVQSRHCRDEVHYALKHEKPMVVVYLDGTDLPRGLDLALNSIQAVRRNEEEPARYLDQLLQALSPNKVIAQGVTLSRGDKGAYGSLARRKAPMIGLGLAAVAMLAVGIALSVQLRSDDSAAAVTGPATGSDAAVGSEEIDVVALQSVAVLPFVNMSGDPDLGFFANGIADGILDELAQAESVRVASRTAAFQLAGEGQDLQTIAKQLNVAYVLEGSVQRMGDRVRTIAQLIRAKDGYHVWSKTYPGAYSDGFEMQEAVANNAANIVRSKVWSDIRRQHPVAFSELRGAKPEAVGYLLDAEEHFNRIFVGEGGDYVHYRQLLHKAVEIDPDFAYAHGELAWCYAFMFDRSVAPKEAADAAHAAIERALELGQDRVEALYPLALIYMNLDLDYARAEAAFREGLELHPGGPMWSFGLAYIAATEGRAEAAQRYLATFEAVDVGEDPGGFYRLRAILQRKTGELAKAADSYAEALDYLHAGPFRADVLKEYAAALVMLNRIDEAKAAIAAAWDANAQYPVTFAHLYAKTGEERKARRILQQTQPTPVNSYEIALGYLALGEIDQAFESIRSGIKARNHMIATTLRADRSWDPIRDDPRFAEMLALLNAEVKHTPRFLQDHGLAAHEPS